MSQRFTDAELAAEYWAMHLEGQVAITQELSASCNEEHNRAEYWGEELGRIAPKLQALQRFATLPHAQDEPGAYVFQCKNCPANWETDDEQRLKIFARNHQYLAHDYWKENQ